MSELVRVRAAGDGSRTRFLVRAQPGARRSGVVGTWNEHVKIALRSPPEDGRANEELLDVLAEVLGVRAGRLALVRGTTSRQKELEVDLPSAVVLERLRAALPRDELRP